MRLHHVGFGVTHHRNTVDHRVAHKHLIGVALQKVQGLPLKGVKLPFCNAPGEWLVAEQVGAVTGFALRQAVPQRLHDVRWQRQVGGRFPLIRV